MAYKNLFGFKGLYTDLRADYLPEGALAEGSKNVKIIDGMARTKSGFALLSTGAVADDVLGFTLHTDLGGAEKLVCYTKSHVYYLSGTTWVDVNDVGVNYSATLAERWSASIAYDAVNNLNLLLLSNISDGIVKWTGESVNVTGQLGGNPPKARALGTLSSQVIAANLYHTGANYPLRIAFSAKDQPELWHQDVGGYGTGTEGEGYQDLYDTDGAISFIAPFLNYRAIVKTDAIIMMVPTGNIDDPFTYEWIVKGRGSRYRTYCSIPGGLLLITDDDIVLFDGTSNLKSIVDGKIRRAFFAALDSTNKYITHSAYMSKYKEWRIYAPSPGNSRPNTTWIYNTQSGEWYYDENTRFVTAASDYKFTSIVTWDTDAGTWDEATGTWDEAGGSEVGGFIHGDELGYTYLENEFLPTEENQSGVPVDISAIANIVPVFGTDIHVVERWSELWINIETTGNSGDLVSVDISLDKGITWVAARVFAQSESRRIATKKLLYNRAGMTAMVRISGRAFRIIGMKWLYTAEGLE